MQEYFYTYPLIYVLQQSYPIVSIHFLSDKTEANSLSKVTLSTKGKVSFFSFFSLIWPHHSHSFLLETFFDHWQHAWHWGLKVYKLWSLTSRRLHSLLGNTIPCRANKVLSVTKALPFYGISWKWNHMCNVSCLASSA